MLNLTKNEILGYVVMSCQQLKMKDGEIKKIVNQINENIEVWTEVHAEKEYENFIEELGIKSC